MSYPEPLDIEPKLSIVKQQMPRPVMGKVEELAQRVSVSLPEDHRDPEFVEKVKRLLAASVTEESTDALIDIVKGIAPWGSGFVIGWALDRLLPEQLLSLTYSFLDSL